MTDQFSSQSHRQPHLHYRTNNMSISNDGGRVHVKMKFYYNRKYVAGEQYRRYYIQKFHCVVNPSIKILFSHSSNKTMTSDNISSTTDLHSDEFKKLFAPTSKEVRDQHLEKKREKYRAYKNRLDSLRNTLRDVIMTEKDLENFSHIDVPLEGEIIPDNIVEQLDIDTCMKEFLESEYVDHALYWVGAYDEDYIKVKGTEAQDIIKRRARGAKVNANEEELDDDQDDLEFLNPKSMTKQEALQVFTGRKHVGKKFKFVTQALDKVLLDVKQRTIAGGDNVKDKFNISIDRAMIKNAVEQLIKFENKSLKNQENDVAVGGRKNKVNRATTELQTKFLISPSFYVNVVTVIGKPSSTGAKPYIIPLKKPIFDKEETSMCIFVRDNKKEEFKQILQDQPFSPNLKIMKLSRFLKGFKTPQEKHLLVSQYDFFFAEQEILTSMVPLLGKAFYSKRKGPRPVTTENVIEWMNKELDGTKVFLTPGKETL
jgi:hypothetical protein